MKSLLLESKNFRVLDGRRGNDYQNREGFQTVLSIFEGKENAEAWNELLECIFDEFGISSNQPLTFLAMGDRTFSGQANRSKFWIKVTPCSAYEEGAINTTIVHELGHIVTPTKFKHTASGMRRDVHGPLFKKNTYRIAQLAFAVGLLKAHEVTYDIGLSYIHREKKEASTTDNLRVGTMVKFEHTGRKWAGVWTGRVAKVNTKTYNVVSETRDGKPLRGMQWRISRNTNQLEVIE